MSKRIAVPLLSLFVLVAISCAPIRATSSISKAKGDLAAAKEAGASDYEAGKRYETRAQMNFFMAQTYLEKAYEFQGFSEFGAATLYAERASDLAREAVKLLQEAAKLSSRRCVLPQEAPEAAAPIEALVPIEIEEVE